MDFRNLISRFLFDKPGEQQLEYTGQSEELSEDGKVIVQHYQDAKSAKNLVEARFIENHKYWANRKDQEEDALITENVVDFSTNICFPLVEGKTALALEKNIAIQCHGHEPSDQAFSSAAENLLEFINRSNKPMRKNEKCLRNISESGSGVFYMYYDDEWAQGFGLPTFDPIDSMYFYVDDNITDPLKAQEAEYMFFCESKTILWAIRRFGEEKAKAIGGGSGLNSDEDFTMDHTGPDPDNVFTLLHYFTREYIKIGEGEDSEYKAIIRYIQASSDGAILYDTKDDEELRDDDGNRTGLFPFTDRYPFVIIPNYPDAGSFWAYGDIDQAKPIQNALDALDLQILNNARLTGNPQKKVNPDMLDFDYTDWTNEPGINIPIKGDINQAADYMRPPDMPAYIINRRDRMFDVDRPTVTLHNDQMVGQQQKGVDTATEALAISQGGMVPIDRIKAIYEEAMSEVFSFLLEMAIYYWTEEKFFRINNNGKEEFFSFNPSILGEIPQIKPMTKERRRQLMDKAKENGIDEPKIPEYMQVKQTYIDEDGEEKFSKEGATRKAIFDIQITIGAGMPQSKPFIYKAVSEMFATGLLTKPESRKLVVDFLNIPIDPESPEFNIEEIVNYLTEHQDMIPALLQTLQKMGGGQTGAMTGQTTDNPAIAGVAGSRPSPERMSGTMEGVRK